MLWRVSELRGYEALATDGAVGRVADLLFDDARWGVRWFIIDSAVRCVLLPASALGRPDEDRRCLMGSFTRQEVESGPAVARDQTVTREHEAELYRHYGRRPYWEDDLPPLLNYLASASPSVTGFLFPPRPSPETGAAAQTPPPAAAEPRLRKAMELAGYRIRATDGDIGHVEDFVVDDEPWAIRYMIVGTRARLPGRMVLISPHWIAAVDWEDHRVTVEATRRQIDTSPAYDPLRFALTREDEIRLHAHYGRTGYWE